MGFITNGTLWTLHTLIQVAIKTSYITTCTIILGRGVVLVIETVICTSSILNFEAAITCVAYDNLLIRDATRRTIPRTWVTLLLSSDITLTIVPIWARKLRLSGIGVAFRSYKYNQYHTNLIISNLALWAWNLVLVREVLLLTLKTPRGTDYFYMVKYVLLQALLNELT